jgi:hypothetical protein
MAKAYSNHPNCGVYSHHAGCAALAIKEKEEKKPPSPCKREREKKSGFSLSISRFFLLF